MKTQSFQLSEIVFEATRNLVSARLRTIITVLLAMAAGFGVVAASLSEVDSIRSAWVDRRDAGAYVFIVRPVEGVGFPAATCESLNSVEGVRSAGSLLESEEVYAATKPGTRYAVAKVSPGYMSIAWPTLRSASSARAVAGSTMARELGLTSGAYFMREPDQRSVEPVPLPVDDVAKSGARIESADRAILVATPPSGSVSECAVEALPGSSSAVASVIPDWFAPSRVASSEFLRDNGLGRDPGTEIRVRSTQWVPILAGIMVAVLQLAMWWGRRAEVGIYRMLGLGTNGLLLLITTEIVVTVAAPAMVGATAATLLLFDQNTGLAASAATRDLVKLGLLFAISPLLIGVTLRSYRAIDLVRGR